MDKIRVLRMYVDRGDRLNRAFRGLGEIPCPFTPASKVTCIWRCETCLYNTEFHMVFLIPDEEHIIEQVGLTIIRDYVRHMYKDGCYRFSPASYPTYRLIAGTR